MLIPRVSRLKCSKLSGGVGERGKIPVGRELGGGDCVAMTGISHDVDVGVVRVECVSPLEPEFGPIEGVLWLVKLVKGTLLFVS